jgi:hypothetical protein
MFPQDFIDTFVIFFMFFLRIGVPIILTLAFGYWLEKKLAPQEEIRKRGNELTIRPTARAGKIIKIHCWDIKRCDFARRAQCAAFQHPELPCWLALQAEGDRVREECFTCAFYKPETMAA